MTEIFICRRCGGRGKIWIEGSLGTGDCYVCLGKGKIELTPEEIREYFQKLQAKNDTMKS